MPTQRIFSDELVNAECYNCGKTILAKVGNLNTSISYSDGQPYITKREYKCHECGHLDNLICSREEVIDTMFDFMMENM